MKENFYTLENLVNIDRLLMYFNDIFTSNENNIVLSVRVILNTLKIMKMLLYSAIILL